MEPITKLIVCAVLSLSIGIAAASPLLVSELKIRPWITHVQGPTVAMALFFGEGLLLHRKNKPEQRNNGKQEKHIAEQQPEKKEHGT